MVDEKDRLHDRLKEKEKAEEDRYFRQRDEEALARIRREKQPPQTGTGQCPRDGAALVSVTQHGVTVDECPTCHGLWMDQGECEALAKRERESWLGRIFFRPRL